MVLEKFFFIVASCMELALGMLEMCKYEFAARRILLWGFFFIYVLAALRNKYSQKEKLVFSVTMLLGGLLYLHSGINTGIKAPVYIFALKGMDQKKVFRYMLITMLSMFGVIFLLALRFDFGTLYIYDIRKNRGFDGLRFCFGFSNPNMFQFALYGALSYAIYIERDRMNGKRLACIMAVYMGISFFTNSRTGMLVAVFTSMGVFLISKLETQKYKYIVQIYESAFVCMLVFFLAISFLAAMDVEKGFFLNAINKFISERMNQLGFYTKDEIYALPYIENWTLFSGRGNKNFYDMGYIQIFYYYGIVEAVCYLAFVVYAVHQAQKRGNLLEIVILMGLCMYLFMEARYFSNYLTRDFLLMVSAGVVWGKHEKNISMDF